MGLYLVGALYPGVQVVCAHGGPHPGEVLGAGAEGAVGACVYVNSINSINSIRVKDSCLCVDINSMGVWCTYSRRGF
jgi:hypothetical protein